MYVRKRLQNVLPTGIMGWCERAHVGRVEAFAIEGLTLWFWSHDHGPPHFHIKRLGEWELRVYFLETTAEALAYEMKWGARPNTRLLNRIAREVADHMEVLLAEWELKTCGKTDQ